jgi:hypothetical protein
MKKTYTEKELEVFTQLYSSNFEARCVQEYEDEHFIDFDWKEFAGKKIKEKIQAFNKAIELGKHRKLNRWEYEHGHYSDSDQHIKA